MKQPEGFIVMKVKKYYFGLMQSLGDFLLKLDYKKSNLEPCSYKKK